MDHPETIGSVYLPHLDRWEIIWIAYDHRASLPHRAYQHNCGWDFHTLENVTIPPLTTVKLPTGVGIGMIYMVLLTTAYLFVF